MIVGIGVDEAEVDRMATVLSRTPSMRSRLFTAAEQAYAESAEPAMAAQRYAARFAAKEAILKALGAGLGACKFVEIEIARDGTTGAPSVLLRGGAEALASGRGVERWHLSMTHTGTRATAFAVAEAGS